MADIWLVITSADQNTFVIPADFVALRAIYGIGAGYGGGHYGGAFAMVTVNPGIKAGDKVPVQVGRQGAGKNGTAAQPQNCDTWFMSGAVLYAQGAGNNGRGLAAACVPASGATSGGNGPGGSSGGGGAGGSNGAGQDGASTTTTTGGAGDAGFGGAGGTNGNNGGDGQEWPLTDGTRAGAGGGGGFNGNGGLYGGGGGGGVGLGADGGLVFVYSNGGADMMMMF